MNTVTLSDGRPGIRAMLQVEAREPSASSSPVPQASALCILDFIASTDTLDRYREVIDPAGWRLETYRRNPVFQNAHNYGDILFTIGKALITEVRTGTSPYLYQRVQFATDVNPMARIAYGLYRGGFLNAVSVGFIPIRWENGAPEGAFRRKYLEQELLEVSAVAIPANPEALALGLKAGAVHRADLRESEELLRAVVGTLSTTAQAPLAPSGDRVGGEGEGEEGALGAECTAEGSLSGGSKAVSPLRSATALHMGGPTPQLLLDFARELRRIVRRA